MEQPNDSYGYWVLGAALRFGPFTDRESAERCLIALASRSDTADVTLHIGKYAETADVFNQPTKESPRAGTTRR